MLTRWLVELGGFYLSEEDTAQSIPLTRLLSFLTPGRRALLSPSLTRPTTLWATSCASRATLWRHRSVPTVLRKTKCWSCYGPACLRCSSG